MRASKNCAQANASSMLRVKENSRTRITGNRALGPKKGERSDSGQHLSGIMGMPWLLGMSLSPFQHCSFTSDVTIDPGAIPETAVLAHIMRTCLKAAISCLALQNIAGVSLSSNNKTCPLLHSLALNMKANFFRLGNFFVGSTTSVVSGLSQAKSVELTSC